LILSTLRIANSNHCTFQDLKLAEELLYFVFKLWSLFIDFPRSML